MLNFLKKTKTSSEVLKAMFEVHTASIETLQTQRETWNDEEVSFATYISETECLYLFAVFSALQECKLPASEKRILLDLFREVLSSNVRAGKADPQLEINLQDYSDARKAPHPPHLNPLWNVGLAFARHIGADNDIAYAVFGGKEYADSLRLAAEFLNEVGKSYRIEKR